MHFDYHYGSCCDFSDSMDYLPRMSSVKIHVGVYGEDHYYTVAGHVADMLISAFASQHSTYKAFYSTDGKRHAYDLSQVDFIRTV